MKYSGIIILFLMVAFCSCQKVINVKLNSSAVKFVITGNVTDQPGPYAVSITKTIDFDQDNNFPGVSGAIVTITDSNTNSTDTLSEISAGNYHTHALTGTPGHTYQLNVISGNNRFSSSSTMPQKIVLDSLYTAISAFGDDKNIIPQYKDPAGTGNNYHLLLTVNDSVSDNIYIHSDELIDGNIVNNPLRSDMKINTGDIVTVELQCIDNTVYTYYRTLSQTIQQNSATPANPQSNIIGGSLGYFSAHTVNKKTIVVP